MKKYEEAEQDYLSGLKYKDIADKYGVSISTVKSWKSRYWNSDKVATKDKKVAQKVAKVAKPKPTEKAIDELSDSTLTDKQKAFVIDYLRISNATQAYINVYDVPYSTARVSGSRMLTNDNIKNEIKSLRKSKLQELGVDSFDLMEDMVIEARADIGDYIDFGKYDMLNVNGMGEVQLDTEDNPEIYRKSWVQFKDKEKVDTRPIKSIKMGKDGPLVELYDRNKARDKLIDMLKSDRNSAISININPFEEDS
ncbi:MULTISPECIES: terminase small subunit [Leuconostoc gelidum group]|uniref:terminase small subunit n=1 Tax=Leuconostoc gelidum group TaxID=3016637 RepID=UPI00027E6D04|nr:MULTISPECIES: terminase small subunit [Leuconostoc gelidum group]AFS40263.1 prophage terminase small subunit [Leuconostoc gelidum JB7]MBZ5948040.1 terminase small subunit [Leuconostoc gasicomitatum]MBZ5988168.1 terminase small subunit [Leuconostoc gasicomitatum]MBZ5990164.1 terminase small subunit [Leuconostoc gasicomitatum]